jgi:hypothetical protein
MAPVCHEDPVAEAVLVLAGDACRCAWTDPGGLPCRKWDLENEALPWSYTTVSRWHTTKVGLFG